MTFPHSWPPPTSAHASGGGLHTQRAEFTQQFIHPLLSRTHRARPYGRAARPPRGLG
ncbi:hypothetical protein ACFH04_27520 [Streptomyces noboritoensis]|uniref:Uncharacterized protein n=1 Tax=Streptomyces noboritoensis TaxID=67337 RepID=A0ABV6TNT7_9ACTN